MAKRKTQKKGTAKRGKTVKEAAGTKAGRTATKTEATRRGAAAKRKAATKSTTKARGARSKTAGRASKPAKKRFRSAALVDQSSQIHCEAQMLRSVVSLLTGAGSSSPPISSGDREHRNALNESFCLHFRTLLDFLWEGRAGRKEAVARDFFATPRQWRPTKPQDYRDLKKRLAKEIDALTTTRYSDLAIEEWPYRRIFDGIFVDIDRFQSTAPAENLHECWRERPIAALSAAGTRSSTVGGAGSSGADSRSDVDPANEPGERVAEETTALAVGSAFSSAQAPRPDWSSTTDGEEEHDESREDASVFARSFISFGDDEE